MRSLLLCLLAFFADDPWARVRDLKSGTELRIHPHNMAAPIKAQFGDTTDSSLIILIKNKQSATPKDEIDKIDYRPPQILNITKTKNVDSAVIPRTPYESRVPKTESSGGISFGKPDFKTLYERAPSAKK